MKAATTQSTGRSFPGDNPHDQPATWGPQVTGWGDDDMYWEEEAEPWADGIRPIGNADPRLPQSRGKGCNDMTYSEEDYPPCDGPRNNLASSSRRAVAEAMRFHKFIRTETGTTKFGLTHMQLVKLPRWYDRPQSDCVLDILEKSSWPSGRLHLLAVAFRTFFRSIREAFHANV